MVAGKRYHPTQRHIHQTDRLDRSLPDRLLPKTDIKKVAGQWSTSTMIGQENPNQGTPSNLAPITGSSSASTPSPSMISHEINLGPDRYDPSAEVLHHRNASGQIAVYYPRQILPPGGSRALLTEHTVKDGDRLDLIANQYYGDLLLYWEIADANNAMKPEELLRIGTKLLIPNLT